MYNSEFRNCTVCCLYFNEALGCVPTVNEDSYTSSQRLAENSRCTVWSSRSLLFSRYALISCPIVVDLSAPIKTQQRGSLCQCHTVV